MHISLDSALGRQRRLNSVGESVLQIAPNAAAAYSLRSLTGGSPKVVRVRRASDNGERDFTSAEINSGEMVSWVNRQVVAPLDIQELEADGRTGDFLIAKAAYALRSLGTRQATLAATGDTVARADGKFVAQVRRNVNGDLKSFTATEVTDGTLESFVNESFTSSLPLDVAGSAAAAYGLRNLSSSYSGNVVEVRRSSDDTTRDFTAAEITNGTLLAFVGTGGSDNGFVKTWYDQSGNSKDAVQPTPASQPKIVNAGSLVTGGIDFDGTDDIGLVTGSFSLTQTYSTFSVSHTDDASTSQGVWSTAASFDSTFNAAQLFRSDDGFSINSGATLTTAGTINYVADRNYLQTNVVNGGSSSIFVDGATGATGNMGATNPSGVLILGYYKSGSNIQNLDGAIKELIIYDSDQTSNRAALETNIAAANGVTLS